MKDSSAAGDSTVSREPAAASPPAAAESLAREVDAARLDPRRCFGRYLVLSELGKGGMGVVYRAFDPTLQRLVALKVLRDDGRPGAKAIERLQREARSAAKLRHPSIASVHEIGFEKGVPFIAMDFVAGRTLDAHMARGLEPAEAARIARDVALALAHAHGQGIVHRDIKPGNVLIDEAGRPVLLDFGLARDSADHKRLTVQGQILGTILYMAPEQIRAAASAGPAADIYALGAVLYEALTGKPPLDGATAVNVMARILNEPPIPPSRLRSGVPPALEALVLRCLEKEPGRRPESAASLAAELERFMGPSSSAPPADRAGAPRVAARPRAVPLLLGVAAAAFAAMLGAVAATYWLSPRGGGRPPEESDGADRSAAAATPEPVRPIVPPGTWWTPRPEQLDAAARDGQPLWFESSAGMRFVLVPPRTFVMGSPIQEAGRQPGETAHLVTLTRSFFVGATEVTNGQFRRFRPSHRSTIAGLEADGDDQPTIEVDFDSMRAFCDGLSEAAGEPGLYRLPTEAEWEYACRAGTTSAYFWGDDASEADRHCNANDPVTKALLSFAHEAFPRDDGWRGPAPAGSYAPNSWGIHDTSGNVWEACSDWFADYQPGAATDPTVPSVGPLGAYRVMRGGSWFNEPPLLRSAFRAPWSPGQTDDRIGFRVIALHAPSRAR